MVINAMVRHGDMSKVDAAVAKVAPVPDKVKASPAPPLDAQVGYFVEEVKQRLLADTDLGSTAQARYNAVFNGGLKIYTTLDPQMEADAREAVADHLPSENGKWTATLVSVDSRTGAVRALVGGPGYNLSQYRIATEGPGRQPGSSFKPIVLALALKEGYNIHAGVDGSSPCTFDNPPLKPYTAHNAEGGEGGYYDLASALAGSINCAFLRLGIDVGLSQVAQMGRDLGITTPLTPLESMSIGSEEVRPIDMAGVYDTFADDGLHHTPYLVERIVDRNGNVILRGGDTGTQVLSSEKVREELVALREVMTAGTGYASQLKGRPSWGKTGTAENYDNAWFDGFTPAAHHRGVDGVADRQRADDQRVRADTDREERVSRDGVRRDGPGSDLEGVHGPGPGRPAARGFPRHRIRPIRASSTACPSRRGPTPAAGRTRPPPRATGQAAPPTTTVAPSPVLDGRPEPVDVDTNADVALVTGADRAGGADAAAHHRTAQGRPLTWTTSTHCSPSRISTPRAISSGTAAPTCPSGRASTP